MDVSAKVNQGDLKRILAEFEKYGNGVGKAGVVKFYKWASKLAGTAQRHVPVETGVLKASIRGEVAVQRVEIVGAYGTNVRHGIYVEFGTKRIAVGTPEQPRTSWAAKTATHTRSPETMPYLRHSWALHKDEVLQGFKKVGIQVGVQTVRGF